MRDLCVAPHGLDDARERIPAKILDRLHELVAPGRISDLVDDHFGEDARIQRAHRFVRRHREPPSHAVQVPPQPRVGRLRQTIERRAQSETRVKQSRQRHDEQRRTKIPAVAPHERHVVEAVAHMAHPATQRLEVEIDQRPHH